MFFHNSAFFFSNDFRNVYFIADLKMSLLMLEFSSHLDELAVVPLNNMIISLAMHISVPTISFIGLLKCEYLHMS